MRVSELLKKIHDLAEKAEKGEKIIDENDSAEEILDTLFVLSRTPYELLLEGAKRIERKEFKKEMILKRRRRKVIPYIISEDDMANAALNTVIRDLNLDNLSDIVEKSMEISFDEISFEDILKNEKVVREAEIYATTEGIISSDIPKGYRYAEFSLEDIYYYASPEEKEVLEFIRRWNPKVFYKKFYIKKPRFFYVKPEKVWYENGKPVLVLFKGKYYYPKFITVKDPKSGKKYRALRMRIPIERVFEETWGRIKISCIIRTWGGYERKVELLDIKIKFRGEHEGLPRSEYKFIRQAIRNYIKENNELNDNFKKYLREKVSRIGSRNFMLIRVRINGKLIESPLSWIAYRYSRKLGDPKDKAKEYSRYYKGSIILPIKYPEDKYELVFGNQGFRIIERREAEKYIRRKMRRQLKAAKIIKYERKEKPIYDPDSKLYGIIMKWRSNAINHIVFSRDYFEAYILEFEKYTVYYILPSKNGQDFMIVNRHHGKEGLYEIHFRMGLNEALEIIHLDPDLPEEEKSRLLGNVSKNI